MIYIENEGALFRGPSRAWPEEVWVAKDGSWKAYEGRVPKDMEWGSEIPGAEAKRIMAEGASEAA